MPARRLIEMSQTSIIETVDKSSPQSLGDTTIDTSEPSGSRAKSAVNEDKMEKTKSCDDPRIIDSKLSKKKVHFNPKVEKRRHVALKDIPQEERECLWYSKADDKLILLTAKVVVKMIMKGEPFDDIDYCSRGLEGKTMSESKKRSRNKRKLHSAVMMEQEIERLEGVKNPARLANSARKHTLELSVLAYERGKEDERDIQEYMSDVRAHQGDFRKYLSEQSPDSTLS